MTLRRFVTRKRLVYRMEGHNTSLRCNCCYKGECVTVSSYMCFVTRC